MKAPWIWCEFLRLTREIDVKKNYIFSQTSLNIYRIILDSHLMRVFFENLTVVKYYNYHACHRYHNGPRPQTFMVPPKKRMSITGRSVHRKRFAPLPFRPP